MYVFVRGGLLMIDRTILFFWFVTHNLNKTFKISKGPAIPLIFFNFWIRSQRIVIIVFFMKFVPQFYIGNTCCFINYVGNLNYCAYPLEPLSCPSIQVRSKWQFPSSYNAHVGCWCSLFELCEHLCIIVYLYRYTCSSSSFFQTLIHLLVAK